MLSLTVNEDRLTSASLWTTACHVSQVFSLGRENLALSAVVYAGFLSFLGFSADATKQVNSSRAGGLSFTLKLLFFLLHQLVMLDASGLS